MGLSESVTLAQVYELIERVRVESRTTLEQSRDEAIVMHKRTGDRIIEGFARMELRLDAHEREDRLIANRVLIMETERASEAVARKDEAVRVTRRTTFVGMGVSFVVAWTPRIIEALWGKR